LVGDTCTVKADGRSGKDVEAAPGQYSDLSETSDNECCRRGD